MNTNNSFIDIIPYKKDNDELMFDMTGGRIGEGGFGCVLKPAIKCNGTKEGRQIYYKNTIR